MKLVPRRVLPWLAALTLAAGCASPPPPPAIEVDPTLFVPAAPPSDYAGSARATLSMAASVTGSAGDMGNQPARVPVGRIVEQAARRALDAALPAVVAPGGSRADAAADAQLVIEAVRFDYDSRIVALVPVPIPLIWVLPAATPVVHLSIDATLVDGRGHAVWTRTYDSGQVAWKRVGDKRESNDEAVSRMTHETAWQLSRRAVRDLIEWLDEERMRPREL